MHRAHGILASLLLLPTHVTAQVLVPQLWVNFHLTEASYSGCSDGRWDEIDGGECPDLDLTGRTGTAFLWIVAGSDDPLIDGVGGIQVGISHTDAAITGWSLCTGGSEIAGDGWPASGTGNAVTWADGCYEPVGGHQARVGFLGLDDAETGQFALVNDPRIDQALLADCSTETSLICPDNLGHFDATDEYNEPACYVICGDLPVRTGSWGAVKALF